jgi:superfamily II RNA helicase
MRLSLALSILAVPQTHSWAPNGIQWPCKYRTSPRRNSNPNSPSVRVDADLQDFYEPPPQISPIDNDDSIQSARRQIQPHFAFDLDAWQLSAASSIMNGHNVIVCAPTGSGKTVVGEIALRIALEKDTKAIYTTPLKALSNQKFVEMSRVFGVERVGLATGDISIRRGADVTIMTTEVYRSVLFEFSFVIFMHWTYI